LLHEHEIIKIAEKNVFYNKICRYVDFTFYDAFTSSLSLFTSLHISEEVQREISYFKLLKMVLLFDRPQWCAGWILISI